MPFSTVESEYNKTEYPNHTRDHSESSPAYPLLLPPGICVMLLEEKEGNIQAGIFQQSNCNLLLIKFEGQCKR